MIRGIGHEVWWEISVMKSFWLISSFMSMCLIDLYIISMYRCMGKGAVSWIKGESFRP